MLLFGVPDQIVGLGRTWYLSCRRLLFWSLMYGILLIPDRMVTEEERTRADGRRVRLTRSSNRRR